MAKFGIVYVANNPTDGHRVFKVGMSTRSAEERMAELTADSTNLGEYSAVAYYVVEDCEVAEREVHAALEEFRIQSNREFFEHDRDEILATISSTLGDRVLKREEPEPERDASSDWVWGFVEEKLAPHKQRLEPLDSIIDKEDAELERAGNEMDTRSILRAAYYFADIDPRDSESGLWFPRHYDGPEDDVVMDHAFFERHVDSVIEDYIRLREFVNRILQQEPPKRLESTLSRLQWSANPHGHGLRLPLYCFPTKFPSDGEYVRNDWLDMPLGIDWETYVKIQLFGKPVRDGGGGRRKRLIEPFPWLDVAPFLNELKKFRESLDELRVENFQHSDLIGWDWYGWLYGLEGIREFIYEMRHDWDVDGSPGDFVSYVDRIGFDFQIALLATQRVDEPLLLPARDDVEVGYSSGDRCAVSELLDLGLMGSIEIGVRSIFSRPAIRIAVKDIWYSPTSRAFCEGEIWAEDFDFLSINEVSSNSAEWLLKLKSILEHHIDAEPRPREFLEKNSRSAVLHQWRLKDNFAFPVTERGTESELEEWPEPRYQLYEDGWGNQLNLPRYEDDDE